MELLGRTLELTLERLPELPLVLEPLGLTLERALAKTLEPTLQLALGLPTLMVVTLGLPLDLVALPLPRLAMGTALEPLARPLQLWSLGKLLLATGTALELLQPTLALLLELTLELLLELRTLLATGCPCSLRGTGFCETGYLLSVRWRLSSHAVSMRSGTLLASLGPRVRTRGVLLRKATRRCHPSCPCSSRCTGFNETGHLLNCF